MTPRPCKFLSPLGEGLAVRPWGRGGLYLLSAHYLSQVLRSPCIISLTPPLQGRGSIEQGIFRNTVSFVEFISI